MSCYALLPLFIKIFIQYVPCKRGGVLFKAEVKDGGRRGHIPPLRGRRLHLLVDRHDKERDVLPAPPAAAACMEANSEAPILELSDFPAPWEPRQEFKVTVGRFSPLRVCTYFTASNAEQETPISR